jgi:DNA-binding beta-propeller fold protein YncE
MRRLLFASLLIGACNEDKPQVKFQSTCTAAAPSDDAKLPAARNSDGSVILPDGRKITPAGKILTVGGFPVNMRVLPGDRYLVTTDAGYGDNHLRVIDSQATDNPVISDVVYPESGNYHDPGLWYGLALTRDGKKIYVSNGGYDPIPDSEKDPTKHYNVIQVFGLVGDPPQLQAIDAEEIHLPLNGASQRLPSGMALSSDEKTLYVVTQLDGTLGVVDLRPGPGYGAEIGRTPQLGVNPYDLVVDEAAQKAYVTLWGGVFNGGDSFSDGIQAVDLSNPTAPMASGALIATPKATESIILSQGNLIVSATDGDAVVVYNTGGAGMGINKVALDGSGLFGSSPTGMALDSAHNRLYVANANENAVEVFAADTMMPLGRVPTAWYPTTVALAADGTLFIASSKGLGAGPSDHAPGKNDYMQGTLQVLAMPSAADLMMGDTIVKQNFTRPHDYEVKLNCKGEPSFPLPPARGDKTPIEHVVLIVRENKTYDAVLGDLDGTNGTASLAIFGGDITPNLHALAKRFSNLDNFYSLAEQSIQGHEWTTTNFANDYTEKGWLTTWGRYVRAFGDFSGTSQAGHMTVPASGTIWQAFDAVGMKYHNYGEIVNSSDATIVYDTNYPGVFFNIKVPDVMKIEYVNSNLADRTFELEPFSYISLPNDHTLGTTPGEQTPRSLVADNDEATGRFVDALSHSNYWQRSAVFLIEDDPSDGGDHVEIHRSPCLVISPWAKAGYTSSVHYDVPAMWKTITLLLDMPPINQRDANAAAFYDVFSTTMDARPYTYIPRKIMPETNAADAPLAEESAKIDFSQPDTAPLGRILWKSIHGRDAEPPWGKLPLVRDDDD